MRCYAVGVGVPSSEDEKVEAGPGEEVLALQERLETLESRLIAQEHRPLAILNDLRKQPTRSDKWWSAFLALFVRLFLASPVVAAGAGTVAVAGVWFAYVSTEHFEVQNQLVRKQNEFFQRQIQQEAVQDFRARRAQLLRTIHDRRACRDGEEESDTWRIRRGRSGCPAASIEARAAAAVTLVQILRVVRESPGDWPGVFLGPGTELVNAPLAKANLEKADLREVNLNGANLHGANLNDAYLRQADLRQADLREALLWNVAAYEVNLGYANLSRAGLAEADLRQANLTSAIANEANLRGANLKGATLNRADLKGADLRDTNLHGTDLSGAALEGADLRGCTYCPNGTPRSTRWPGGQKPASLWCRPAPAKECGDGH